MIRYLPAVRTLAAQMVIQPLRRIIRIAEKGVGLGGDRRTDAAPLAQRPHKVHQPACVLVSDVRSDKAGIDHIGANTVPGAALVQTLRKEKDAQLRLLIGRQRASGA